ncbi:MAG: gliding motility-associated C-terminal domain-containing protein [Bacteroidota bacterium]|nr:gliding motility-associated C-terminal domain-containing protein [Bacteroidota bacterium]
MRRILLVVLAITLLPLFSVAQGPCVGSETMTATPLPSANGTYFPGTVVTFCYSVSNYAQSSADWIAGVVVNLGPGWDPATLQPVSAAASCDGLGVWGWYTSATGTASGLTFGPGFYYDTPAGATSGTLDGIPGNNFGDNCQTNTWTFCFSVQVADNSVIPCVDGTDLSVSCTALSDYTVGSWGQDDCNDPPSPPLVAEVLCNCSLIVPTINITNASCGNSNDGSITVVAQGIAPYTFLWNTGASTATISNIPPGIYTVTVTDSTLCNKVVTIPVGGPPAIVSNAVVIPNGCTPNGGSITLSPTGGTGSVFTFLWNDGTSTNSQTNLTGGTFTVTITDSLNCTVTETYTINTAVPITLSTSSTATSCNGTDGTATVVASGGTPPFTYSWSPAGGTAATASNLPGGTYTVTVIDSAGCISTAQVTVQAIGSFTLSTTFVPLGCDPAGTTTAEVQITGGIAPFTYLWTPMGGTQSVGTGLTAGTYIVVVTDSNSCVDSATVIIPAGIPVTASAVSTPVQCNNPSSGTATVTGAGGVGNYTYMWSAGSTSATATNLAGGTYTVTVTDAQGCSGTTTVTVSVIPDVFADAGAAQSVCSGQSAVLTGTATGGTAPYSYAWDNGSSGAVITVNPTVTTTYTLTVTDANNCTSTSTVVITANDYPVVATSPDTDICYGAATSLIASGGNNYSWSPAAGLNDPNIANPSANPQVTTTYIVTVSNGSCASSDSVTITVAPEIVAAFSPDTTLGQAPLSVIFTSNSTGGVSYNWDFGDLTYSTLQSPTHVYLQEGNYTVTLVVTNSIGCTDTARYSFILVDELASLTVPNVFTPNNDGKNDVFEFIEVGISSINVNIFNRWGKEVYDWSTNNTSWDGKSKDGEELPDGVYLYIIKARGIDDKSYDYQGTVQMIRNVK